MVAATARFAFEAFSIASEKPRRIHTRSKYVFVTEESRAVSARLRRPARRISNAGLRVSLLKLDPTSRRPRHHVAVPARELFVPHGARRLDLVLDASSTKPEPAEARDGGPIYPGRIARAPGDYLGGGGPCHPAHHTRSRANRPRPRDSAPYVVIVEVVGTVGEHRIAGRSSKRSARCARVGRGTCCSHVTLSPSCRHRRLKPSPPSNRQELRGSASSRTSSGFAPTVLSATRSAEDALFTYVSPEAASGRTADSISRSAAVRGRGSSG